MQSNRDGLLDCEEFSRVLAFEHNLGRCRIAIIFYVDYVGNKNIRAERRLRKIK